MASDRPRLLYIDDDPGLSRLVQKEFERNGFTVELLNTGAAGIERLRKSNDVDVVALDHHMPDQLGLDTLGMISALPNPPPVVYVTGDVAGTDACTTMELVETARIPIGVKSLMGSYGTFAMVIGLSTMVLVLPSNSV